MPATKRLRMEDINLADRDAVNAFEQEMFTAALERIRAEGDELCRRGLMDEHGKLLLKELPADMQEGSERDFGG